MRRNYSIDILRFICAILIVFLHADCSFQWMILPLTRCAVPCFFMISGYLLFNNHGIGYIKLKRNIGHVVGITIWATIIFIIWKELLFIKRGGFVPSLDSIGKWLFLNECPFAGHLWYLYAYIYILLIVCMIDKYRLWNILFMAIPILLLTDLAFGKYSIVIFNREFPYIFVRNFLFVGLPYFALGAFLKTKNYFRLMNRCTLLGGGNFLFSDISNRKIYFDKHR